MNLPGKASASRTLAVILIAFALLGTEFSYHFTLESRFDAIEDKLQQNSLAIQQFQSSVDTLSSSKTETLAELNKEVVALQSSFGPLGKATQAQTDSLAQLHQQIATLQQAQDDQLNAQKKLFGSVAQLEKAHLKVHLETDQPPVVAAPAPATAPVSAPAPAAPVPAPETVSAPAPASVPPATPAAAPAHAALLNHHAAVAALHPAPLANEDSVDLRSDENGDGSLPSPGMMASRQTDAAEEEAFPSVRALPVATSMGSGQVAR
jgi:uncharacterized protein YukE